ncbi:MAG: U32 family peptidase [Peptococcaceae bacterium]|nr:U32 family peptidase [Peptococcaceae bacterium]MDH7525028.1 U32 family peptidase [Peptococcaceae bacterium]
MEEIRKECKVTFDLAANFDKQVIDVISTYGDFEWVYGKMNHDVVGGGRPSIRLPILSWKELADYIEYCHRHNIKFNYLLNALCLGGMEFQKSFHQEVVELLKRISSIKADGVTIASPYLCEIIKNQFPHLYVSVSIYNKVQTLTQLQYWKMLGADEVTMFHTVNRDFKKLKQMMKYAKLHNITIRLIANNSCLHECPFHANHAVTHAHGSKDDAKTRLFHVDYQILNCNLLKIKDPSRIVSSEWIRPEDIHYYEELSQEVGYDRLTLKLTERGRTTEWLLRVAEAYHHRSYRGNLLDIVNFVGKGNFYGKLHDEHLWKQIEEEGYNEELFRNYRESIFYTLPYLDNTKLDNFLKFFIDHYQCDSKMCDESDYDSKTPDDYLSGETCSYCRVWAKKALSIDPEERKRIIGRAEKALDDVNSSRLFYSYGKG